MRLRSMPAYISRRAHSASCACRVRKRPWRHLGGGGLTQPLSPLPFCLSTHTGSRKPCVRVCASVTVEKASLDISKVSTTSRSAAAHAGAGSMPNDARALLVQLRARAAQTCAWHEDHPMHDPQPPLPFALCRCLPSTIASWSGQLRRRRCAEGHRHEQAGTGSCQHTRHTQPPLAHMHASESLTPMSAVCGGHASRRLHTCSGRPAAFCCPRGRPRRTRTPTSARCVAIALHTMHGGGPCMLWRLKRGGQAMLEGC